MITLEILQKLCPKTKSATLKQYVDALNDVADYYDISDNTERLACFLAQLAHESGGFTAVKENLNYGAAGLMTTFKKYFPTIELAKEYERKPQRIANRVYANRMDNGDESSGDGWKFRGRGLIQITGRYNYTQFAKGLKITLDECVAYMETPEGAVSSAGWFWDNNDLNSYCDKKDFIGLTKRINGGTNGLEDRKHHYELAKKLLEEQK
jgi:putative chitinase